MTVPDRTSTPSGTQRSGAQPSGAQPSETHTALEEIYAKVKRVQRDLRPSDRIVQDLGIDSLATLEILLALEERFGVALVDNPRTAGTATVGDLVALLDELRADRAS
ncbi:acyl carrier protein [Streptomyces sp. SD11]|uniref:acyl carrier protein n=1 Tax=unclassified Streptomyces TaxID=2593676 RepID=UPI00200C9842|nr:acyl carrier protein [Streptomyces sp. LRE541]UPZ26771.1 acyl carrier protein [Streptomyces sp. LRE541]